MTTLSADWDAPAWVRTISTTRSGGVSTAPYASLNLGAHVGDDPERVRQNRHLLQMTRGWDTPPLWLNQVHGNTIVQVVEHRSKVDEPPTADGAVTELTDCPLVVLTADCLPVLMCDKAGTVIGAFHAGWRGLLSGVLEEGLKALNRPARDILAWIGPCIGPQSYQVGYEVYQAFLASNPAHEAEFLAEGSHHWKFDLAGAAVRRLTLAGVVSVTRSQWDTFRDTDLFYSHRRQNPCGRIGTLICLEKRRTL